MLAQPWFSFSVLFEVRGTQGKQTNKKNPHNNCHPRSDAGQSHKVLSVFLVRTGARLLSLTARSFGISRERGNSAFLTSRLIPSRKTNVGCNESGWNQDARSCCCPSVTKPLSFTRKLESRGTAFTENDTFSFLLGVSKDKLDDKAANFLPEKNNLFRSWPSEGQNTSVCLPSNFLSNQETQTTPLTGFLTFDNWQKLNSSNTIP